MQEDDAVLPLADCHAVAADGVDLIGQLGQLVVVRGEQAAAAQPGHQMLDRRPCNRQSVKRGRTAPDFVEDHERMARPLIQDSRGFDHLDHEGRATPRQIIGGPDPAEQAVDWAQRQ